MEPTELFPVASGLERVVIDVHYYNLFVSAFDNLTVQQNIDFIYTNRTTDLNTVTTSNGPLTFVGMWSESHFVYLWFDVGHFIYIDIHSYFSLVSGSRFERVIRYVQKDWSEVFYEIPQRKKQKKVGSVKLFLLSPRCSERDCTSRTALELL